ncbi:MAG: FAD-dependent monooxygenase [Pigmentiphaga sp.]|uniref:FAD-dependent oxidoreductase n=1 Tax=Pigmentiphaga sp. TaxID=1977564 RepID=UPI0029A31083|nr:FAD-dependent monooxygenase [Pigmentiphaga sp.]MDX3905957.1 FAD-dependent monooxygenase [Pigmentiphaga sp.]
MPSPDSTRRVIIAGAGPVGLTAAVALANQGIPVTVLEAEPALTHDLRAGTFHPPTMEMLAAYGVTDAMLEQGLKVPHWQVRDREMGVVAEWDLGMLADVTPYPFRLHLEQHKLARILLDKLLAYPDTEILFSTPLSGIEQDAGGVTAFASRDGETLRIRGKWLIGCDGGRSFTRKAIGSEFEGFTWPERFAVLSTDYDLSAHGYARNAYIADPQEWVAVFCVPHDGPPGLWRAVFPITDPDEPDEEVLSSDGVQRRLKGFMPWRDHYDVPYASIYRVHQRVAKDWRVGRVLLAGDAAHVNNPLGAFGLNGGLHDAINLAGKLGAVWHGRADDTLLDRYVRQRRNTNIDFVQATSIRNKRLLEERDPGVRRERFDELRRQASDRNSAIPFLLQSSMIMSLRKAEEIQ